MSFDTALRGCSFPMRKSTSGQILASRARHPRFKFIQAFLNDFDLLAAFL